MWNVKNSYVDPDPLLFCLLDLFKLTGWMKMYEKPVLVALSVLVAHKCCNSAIGGQGQLGHMWLVGHKSSSEQWISAHIKPKDVDTHS